MLVFVRPVFTVGGTVAASRMEAVERREEEQVEDETDTDAAQARQQPEDDTRQNGNDSKKQRTDRKVAFSEVQVRFDRTEQPASVDENESARTVVASQTQSASEPSRMSLQPYTYARYAWLPSDFAIFESGRESILSYINNLHPVQQSGLYDVIRAVFERCLPLFERTLTDLRHPRGIKVPVGDCYDPSDEQLWREARTAKAATGVLEDEGAAAPSALDEGIAAERPDDDAEDDEWQRTRPLYQPDVIRFQPPPPPPTVASLRGRTVQVITKLSTITLTPTQPQYDGDVWQVSGLLNECIVATAVCYYDVANISDCGINLRQAVCEPLQIAMIDEVC